MKEIKEMVIGDNLIIVDGTTLKFPMSLVEVVAVFGEYTVAKGIASHTDWYKTTYVFHNYGILFSTDDYTLKNLKRNKAYIDDEHFIESITIYKNLSEKMISSKLNTVFEYPKSVCNIKIMINQYENKETIPSETSCRNNMIEIFPSYTTKVYILPPDNMEVEFDSEGQFIYPVVVSYSPKRPQSAENYKIKKLKEEELHFDNFNFKLAILQVLIYDLELLKPYFNIEDFSYQYTGSEIDLESEQPIKPAINFFKKLPIPKSLAEKVEEINMDGGNDIYMNITPLWDGEDGYFDINAISDLEISQFHNLKKVSIMSDKFDDMKKIFNSKNIEVE